MLKLVAPHVEAHALGATPARSRSGRRNSARRYVVQGQHNLGRAKAKLCKPHAGLVQYGNFR
jgi:hypothetical protein